MGKFYNDYHPDRAVGFALIPIFQRPYSLEEETALELFGDIDQAMVKSDARSSATYFLGPMIVAQSVACCISPPI